MPFGKYSFSSVQKGQIEFYVCCRASPRAPGTGHSSAHGTESRTWTTTWNHVTWSMSLNFSQGLCNNNFSLVSLTSLTNRKVAMFIFQSWSKHYKPHGSTDFNGLPRLWDSSCYEITQPRAGLRSVSGIRHTGRLSRYTGRVLVTNCHFARAIVICSSPL
jgi:hypothetical protein